MIKRNSPIPDNLLSTPSPLINDFIDYMNHTTMEYVPQYSLQTAMTFFSHMYARQYIGGSGLPTNTYSFIVGQSGIGKNYCKESLYGFKELHPNIIGGATSGSGLFTALVRNPSILMVSDEIGDKINSSSDNIKSLWALIRTVSNTKAVNEDSYSGRGKGGVIEEKKENYTINYPCLSILGLTTPDQLSSGLSGNDIESGTLNRIVVINAFTDEIQDNHDVVDSVHPDLKRRILESGSRRYPELGMNSYSKVPALKKIHFLKEDDKKLRIKRRELMNEKNSIYTVRSLEKARIAAVNLSISMGLDTVPTSVLNWCMEYEFYWIYNVKKMSEDAGSNEYANDVKKITNKLKMYSENGIELEKFHTYFRRTIGWDAWKRKNLIDDMVNDKILEVAKGPKSVKTGKAKTHYFYIGDKRK